MKTKVNRSTLSYASVLLARWEVLAMLCVVARSFWHATAPSSSRTWSGLRSQPTSSSPFSASNPPTTGFEQRGAQVLEQCGLTVEHQCEASARSWDRYERAVLEGRLKLAASLPADAAESLRSRASSWYSNYEQHGRLHFGFNAYVARHAEA